MVAEINQINLKTLRAEYHGLDAVGLIAALSGGEFADKVFVTSSYGSESAVLLDLVAAVDKSLPVVFLDTEKLFVETIAYAKTLSERLGLTNLVILKPTANDVNERDPNGDLWSTDPDACCQIRKVLPLQGFLATNDWKVWINGRKRFHGGKRQNLAKIETVGGLLKVNPIADWSAERVAAVFADRNLPPHPLADKGYPSIGCKNCTHKVEVGERALRSGRWGHRAEKTECGIHTINDNSNQTKN